MNDRLELCVMPTRISIDPNMKSFNRIFVHDKNLNPCDTDQIYFEIISMVFWSNNDITTWVSLTCMRIKSLDEPGANQNADAFWTKC